MVSNVFLSILMLDLGMIIAATVMRLIFPRVSVVRDLPIVGMFLAGFLFILFLGTLVIESLQ